MIEDEIESSNWYLPSQSKISNAYLLSRSHTGKSYRQLGPQGRVTMTEGDIKLPYTSEGRYKFIQNLSSRSDPKKLSCIRLKTKSSKKQSHVKLNINFDLQEGKSQKELGSEVVIKKRRTETEYLNSSSAALSPQRVKMSCKSSRNIQDKSVAVTSSKRYPLSILGTMKTEGMFDFNNKPSISPSQLSKKGSVKFQRGLSKPLDSIVDPLDCVINNEGEDYLEYVNTLQHFQKTATLAEPQNGVLFLNMRSTKSRLTEKSKKLSTVIMDSKKLPLVFE